MKNSAHNLRLAQLIAVIVICLVSVINTLDAQQLFNESAPLDESPDTSIVIEKDAVKWVESNRRKEAILGAATVSANPVIYSAAVSTVNNDQTYAYNFYYDLPGTVQSVTATIPDWLTFSGNKDGIVSTFSGSGTGGFGDGMGTAAHFQRTEGLAFDSAGNLFVADPGNHRIRKITPEGVVTTFAGDGVAGLVDGANARFNAPQDLAFDAAGNMYVADASNSAIRKITPAGVVSTIIASSGGIRDGAIGGDAKIHIPMSIVLDADGNIYFMGGAGDRIRKISTDNFVSTVTTAISSARAMAIGPDGNIYVAHTNNSQISKVTPAGSISVFAGSSMGYADGQGTAAKFQFPMGLVFDDFGNLYIADTGNHRIRKITPSGAVSTVAGTGFTGSANGLPNVATFDLPTRLAISPITKELFISDNANHLIRKISKSFTLSGAAAGHVGNHNIELTVTDTDANSTTQNFTLTVVDVAAPVITSANTASFAENASGTVHTATATDLEAFTFSLGTSRDEALFNIDAASGAIAFKNSPDFEIPSDGNTDNVYEVEVKVNDGTFTSTQILSITVTNVDDTPPVFTSQNTASIAENITGTVYTAVATDVNPLTYSLGNANDESLFNINTNSGALSFKSAPDFDTPTDGNTDNVYKVEIIANDALNTTSFLVNVSVTNIDETAPVITSDPTASFQENATGTAYQVFATDNAVATDANTISYSLGTGNDENLFDISNGLVTFKSVPDHEAPADANVDNVYVINVIANDGTNTTNQNVSISVINLNDNDPVITSASTVSVNDNALLNFSVQISDADGDAVTVSSTNHEDWLNLSTAGALTGNPSGKESGNYPFMITATDVDGRTDTQLFTVTIVDVTTPVFTSATTANFGEHDTGFVYSVAATDANSLTYTLGNGHDEAFFNISPDGNITFKSSPDFENPQDANADNAYVVEVKANDRVHTVSQLVAITVTDQNDNPHFTSSAPTTVNDNEVYHYEIVAQDVDKDAVSISAATLPAWLSLTGAVITGSAAGQSGVHQVSLVASDGRGGTTNQDFTISITDVTAPLFTSAEVAGFAENDLGTVYTATATDTNPITYSLGNSNDESLFDINAGAVSFKTAPDFENPQDGDVNNTYIIEVIANDGINSTPQIITITVTNENDNSPVFTGGTSVTVNDNATLKFPIPVSDGDEDVITVTATSKPAWVSTSSLDVAVSTLAGAAQGDAEGTGTAAQFGNPYSVALDAAGNLYVADQDNHKIRKISPQGVVSTLAGSTQGDADGTGAAAQFNQPGATAVDATGNVYVADTYNHKIRKITPEGVVTTLAGSTQGFADGTGAAAQFDTPYGLDVDSQGNVYVGDILNNRIRKISPAGVVSTLAGSTPGFANGPGATALFSYPAGVALDAAGNVYVADTQNHMIRKISPTGQVSTLAGSVQGYQDGIGSNAQFYSPWGVDVDAQGNVYVADRSNHKVRKISSAGKVSTVAGSTIGFKDGTPAEAQFQYLTGVAVDAGGTIYVADKTNHRIRKINPPTLTGAATGQPAGNQQVTLRANDGNGRSTTQSFIITVVDATAPVFTSSSTVSVVENTTGTVYTATATDSNPVTYSLGACYDETLFDITSGAVSFKAAPDFENPLDVDRNNAYRIEVIASDGVNTTTRSVTITVTNLNEAPVFTSTPITSIRSDETYNYPITTNDVDGNEVTVSAPVLPDWLTLSAANTVSTFSGSDVFPGSHEAIAIDGPVATARFRFPTDLTFDAQGNLYVVDKFQVRKITTSGVVTTLAGSAIAGFANGTGSEAQFTGISGLAVDATGNVFVADQGNFRIRKITPAGVVSTFAGSGNDANVDGTGTAASLGWIGGLDIDGVGNLYVIDAASGAIRMITPEAVVTTLGTLTGQLSDLVVDGTGTVYYTSSQGVNKRNPDGSIQLVSNLPVHTSPITMDKQGNLYVTHEQGHSIYRITPDGTATKIAGTGNRSFADGIGSAAAFDYPGGLAFNATGDLFVGDARNHRIRRIILDQALRGDPSEQTGNQNVSLRVQDSNGAQTTQDFSILVNDVSAPVFTSGVTASCVENQTGTVYTAVATDANTVSYSLGNTNDEALFDISSGAISFKAAPDFENPTDSDGNNTYVIEVIANDGSNTASQVVTITVTNVDDTAPVFTSGVTASFVENQTGTAYTAMATDANTITYSLGNANDEGLFNINAGTVTFKVAPDFESPTDSDGNNTYVIEVIANDGINTTSQLVTITVTNVDDTAPVFTSGVTTSFVENQTGTAYTAMATDANTLTYSLGSSNDEALFDLSSGVVSFKAVPDFENPDDGDGNNTYVIEVIANDGINTASQLVTITVTNLNEAPVFTSTPIATIRSDETYNYPISVNDVDGNEVTVSAPVLPEWLTLTAANIVSTFSGSDQFPGPEAISIDGSLANARFAAPAELAFDAQGNLYVVDKFQVRKITTSGVVTTLAGSATHGFVNGTGSEARFSAIVGLVVDASGNVFVSDRGNFRIRKITSAGVVSTFAGSGNNALVDGTGINASFGHLAGLDIDGAGNLYVMDAGSRAIRKITPEGVVTTLSTLSTLASQLSNLVVNDSGTVYYTSNQGVNQRNPDGSIHVVNNLPVHLSPIAMDKQGNLYVVHQDEHSIYRITPDGTATKIAGTGNQAFADGIGAAAAFDYPSGFAFNATGDLFVGDGRNHRIRRIILDYMLTGDPSKQTGNHAVSLRVQDSQGAQTTQGFSIMVNDVTSPVFTSGVTASFVENQTGTAYTAMATDANTITYSLGNANDESLFNINAGAVTFKAAPDFENPADSDGNNSYVFEVIASDGSNIASQTVTISVTNVDDTAPVFTSGVTANFIENQTGTAYTAMATDANTLTYSLGSGNDESLFNITSGAVTFKAAPDFESPTDSDGNNTYVIEVIANDGINTTPQLVTITVTNVDDTNPVFTSGITASFAENSMGTVYTAVATDMNTVSYSLGTNHDESLFAISAGVVTFKTSPDFESPQDDNRDNNYVIEVKANDGINVASQTVTISVTNQNESPVFTATPPATVDDNAIYNYRIVTSDEDRDALTVIANTLPDWLTLQAANKVSTFAGSGLGASVDGLGTAASLLSPYDITFDAQGNMYVADHHHIRKITPGGEVTTLAGSSTAGFANGTGSEAQFNSIRGLAVDAAGNVFVADRFNLRIRKITPAGTVSTFAGSGSFGLVDGLGTAASFGSLGGIDIDGLGNLYVVDVSNGAIRKIAPDGTVTTISIVNNQVQNLVVDDSGILYFTNSEGLKRRNPEGGIQLISDLPVRLGGVTIDKQGNLYVVHEQEHSIYRVNPYGVATKIAGSGSRAFADGIGADAAFDFPSGLAIDARGDLFVSDSGNKRIRRIVVNPVLSGNASGQTGTHNVNLKVTDVHGAEANQNFTITVNDVTAPVFTSATTVSFAENQSGSAYTTLATDTNALTYSLGSSSDEALFNISSGVVSFKSVPDFESPVDANADNAYVIEVLANDGINTASQTVTINVTNVDDTAPVFTSSTGVSFMENGTGTVYSAVATDANALSYSLGSGNDEALFSISSNVITFKSAPDFEAPMDANTDNSYVIEVIANDGVNTTSLIVTVKVANVDDIAPIFTSSSAVNFTENGTGTVYTAEASDANALTYSLGSNNDEALFDLNSNLLTFKSSPDFENPLDGDGNNTYIVEVLASDGVNSTSQTVTITMVDVDEIAPTVNITSTSGGTTNGAFQVTITFSEDITGFDINDLTLGNAAASNFAGSGSVYTATITPSVDGQVTVDVGADKASDAAGNNNTTATQFSINVDSSALTVSVSSTSSELTNGSFPVTITFSSSVSDFIESDLTLGNASSVGFAGSGTTYTANIVPAADGEVTVDIAAAVAMNGFGTSNLKAVQFSIVNDATAPAFTSSIVTSFTENGTGTVYTAVATDANTITYSLGASNDEALFNLNANVLTFKSSPDFEAPGDANSDNDYVIEMIASDGINTTSKMVTITVTNADDTAPVFTSPIAVSFAENGTETVYTAVATDANALTYSLGSNKDEALFNLSSNQITFKTSPDFENPADGDSNNAYVVEVIANDGVNTSSQTVTITVTNVDDTAPVFTSTIAVSFAENGTDAAYTAMATDANALTYSLGSNKDEALFNLSSNQITFKNSPDFENPADGDGNNAYVVEVIASDGVNTTSQIVTITVTNADDTAPVFTSGVAASFVENGTGTVYTAVATDANAITYSLGSNKDEALFNLSSNQISFKAAPDFENPTDGDGNNAYVIEVIANDGINTTSQTVTITVTNADDTAPVFTSGVAVSFTENITGTAYTAIATDANLLTYSLGSSNDEALFNISANAITFKSIPDFEAPIDGNTDNAYVIEVIANDGINTASQVVTITVTNVDDTAPVFTSPVSADFIENGTGTAYTAVATDANTITYSLGSGNDETLFSISSNVITFKSAPDFEAPMDANSDNAYILELKADDGINAASQTVTITVINADDTAPVFTSGVAANFLENSTGTVYTAVATDVNPITYSLGNGNDESLFDINSGVVTFKSTPDFETPGDSDANNSYIIEVRANDGINTIAQTVTITVLDADEIAPSVVITSAAGGTTNGVFDITITFSESVTGFDINDLNLSNATASNFNGSNKVYTATITPSSNGQVTVDVAANVAQDAANNNNIAAAQFSITADSSALTVEASSASTTLVNAAFSITITFSAPVSDFVEGDLRLENASSSDFAGSGTTYTAMITPVADGDVMIDIPADVAMNNFGTSNLAAGQFKIKYDATAPIFTSATGINFAEHGTGTVYTAMATDADPVAYSLGSANDEALFNIASGVITFKSAPDFENPSDGDANNAYVIEVIAKDGINSTSQTVIIMVTNVDDTAPVFTSGITASFEENGTGTVYIAEATDANAITYSLGNSNDEALFNVSRGVITFKTSPDLENPQDSDGNNTYIVEVIASDGINTTSQKVTITVTDVDDTAPVFTSGLTANFEENSMGVVYTAVATDANALTFSLGSNNDESQFNIVGDKITFKTAPDFEVPGDANADNNYVIEVIANDGINTASQTVTITVTNVDDTAPVFTSASTVNFVENGTSTAYTAMATDANTLTYSLGSSNDEALFSISNGEIVFKTSPDFETPADANADNNYEIEVIANDGINTASQTVTITVIDVDDTAPVFTSATIVNFVENGTGTVYTAVATDANALTYSLGSSNDESLFNIVGDKITFKTAPDFEVPADANADNNYVIEVIANDGINTASQTVTITVTDVDDTAPVFTSASTVNFVENSTSTAYTAMATDANALTYSLGSSNDEALFSISNGEVVFKTSPDFEAPADANADNGYVIEVIANDGINSASHTVTIAVTNVDDTAPVFTSGLTVNFQENGTGMAYTAVATDANALTYSLGNSNDEALFNISDGVVTFKASPDFENPADANTDNGYVIEVIANDGVNTTSQQVTITVTNVDDTAPVFTSGLTANFEENETGTAYTAVATDANALTYSLGNSNDEALFNISSGIVTFKTAPDFEAPSDKDANNTYIIEVIANDGINSTSQVVTITVIDVEEIIPDVTAPVFTSAQAVNFEENGTGTAYTATATDENEITYSLGSSNDEGLFDISGAVVTFKSAPDFENPADANTDNAYVIEVKANDGSNTSSQVVTITVTDVEEIVPDLIAPIFTSAQAVNFEENGTGTAYTAVATDENEITYSLGSSNDEALFDISGAVVTFKSAPDFESPIDANADNAYIIEVKANDGSNTSSQVVTITVTDIEEIVPDVITPIFTSAQAVNFEENGTGTAYTAVATDENEITYSLGNSNDEALFDISGAVVTFKSAPDFESPADANTDNDYVIEVKANDGINAASHTVTITVTNIGEASLRVEGEMAVPTTVLGSVSTFDITIHNDGDGELSVNGLTYPDGFSGESSAFTVGVGASQMVMVSFSPTAAKTYSGDITISSNGGTAVIAVSARAEVVTALDDDKIKEKHINVYPNPANEVMTIDLSELNASELDIKMINLAGGLQFNEESYSGKVLRLDVSEYKSGIYIIQFSDGKSVVRKKVIIKH